MIGTGRWRSVAGEEKETSVSASRLTHRKTREQQHLTIPLNYLIITPEQFWSLPYNDYHVVIA